MRRQEAGRRYLAGFVIAAAVVYLAATSVISAMAWRDTYPMWLVANWFALGLIPAAVSVVLAIGAWTSNSVARSVVALVIVLAALVLWQLFVVSF